MALTREQIEQFQRDGFLCLDLGLDPAQTERIIVDVAPHYPPGDLHAQANGTRIQDAWTFSQAARDLALHPVVLDALQTLYGRKALAFQTLNFPVGTQQRTHSDTIHFNSEPAGFMAGVWVALEDIDEENGALVYYPGSHRLPEQTMQDVGTGIGYEHYPDYESHIEALVEGEGLEAQRARVSRGQAFIWHGNLLHGGGSHPDRSRTRHSQVTHYFFEGCRYYTPMNSTPDKRQWREPQWIGEPARSQQAGLVSRILRRIKRQLGG
ncbi:phytanoyl-CoA dioxygenase family protein [Wenzhouxiangella marina]|uniref:Phytanoyl-CoA dioxygenase n=1 Tax=Wenzhouxiangella marina TaxID=1579979 RepID=A0A0K0XSJ0_9GAMM|nr:phytanoyl-CoA dioxygenase family protein [Wenzhouxiangella marina]AKS40591.1 Phytanoyl-CoA dioxygenase [Wenzhouxiangella marina]MBB6088359.1 ectoine hydroxylase-related dioxygenase (phytanoyl-CoA dioxygenase family) [Wenzhouxiangella marina]